MSDWTPIPIAVGILFGYFILEPILYRIKQRKKRGDDAKT